MVGTLSLKEFELAKIRIKKIFANNKHKNLDSKYGALLEKGAIAAINSKIGTTKKIVDATASNVETSANIYSPADGNITNPMNTVMNLYDTDPRLFKVVTSKEYMLAFTNANTVIGWNTNTAGYPYNVRATNSKSETIATNSLQAYVNYLAAAEMGTAAKAVDTTNFATATTYLVFKCIYNEQQPTDNCATVSINPWVNTKARDLMLSLNYMAENLTLTGMDNGNTDYATGGVIGSIVVAQTGAWDNFNNAYVTIREDAGGRDKFLPLYVGLNFDRAVNRTDWLAFHETISAINGLTRLKSIVNDPFIIKLIDGGYLTFAEAEADLLTTAASFLKNEGFRKFAEKLPQGSSGATAWGEFKDSVWFQAAAQNEKLAQLISSGKITVEELAAIHSTTNSNSGNGIFGGGAGNGGATAANMEAEFVRKGHFLDLINHGVHINTFCAGTGGTTCRVDRFSVAITTASSAATEFGTIYNCVGSSEVLDFMRSKAVDLWNSPDLALASVVASVCDNT